MRFTVRYIIISETISNYFYETFEWVSRTYGVLFTEDAQ